MEFLLLLLFLAFLLAIILVSIGLSRLDGRLRSLEQALESSRMDRSAQLRSRQASAQDRKTPLIAAPSASSTAPEPPAAPLRPERASRTSQEWEALIGGRWLNRIGALALIIGIGFFLKYAFDNDWITESMRVSIGAAAGIILLLGAAFAHKKGFAVFSQGLVGAGIATLYLSVYASFSFYSLVSQPVAFFLMAAVTVVGFTQAFRYDSLAVALLGWLGGFLTPYLLSTGAANEVGLFSYLGLLDAGLILVVIRKDRWMVLEPLALGATFVSYFAWYVAWYSPQHILPTLFFLTLFWCLFFALEIQRSFRPAETHVEARRIFGILNLVLFAIGLYALLEPSHHEWTAPAALILGLVYFLAMLLVGSRTPGGEVAARRYTLTSIALLAAATAIQFDGFVVVRWWSAEALALFAAGARWNRRSVRLPSLVLLGLAMLKLIGTEGAFLTTPALAFTFRLDPRAVAYIALTAALGGCAFLQGKRDPQERPRVSAFLQYGWILVLFVFLTIEINDHFRSQLVLAAGDAASSISFHRIIVFSLVWLVYALLLVRTGVLNSANPLLVSGAAVFFAASVAGCVRGLAFSPISAFRPVLNERSAALLLLAAGGFAMQSWLATENRSPVWTARLGGAFRIAGLLMILALVTGEVRDTFQREMSLQTASLSADAREPVIARLENMEQLALSGVWLLYSIALLGAGIWRKTRSTRIISIVFFGVTILKIFLYDLNFLSLLYRIFSFIGLGIVLLAVSYLYQRYRTVILGDPGPGR